MTSNFIDDSASDDAVGMPTVHAARMLAERMIRSLGDRWRHTVAVAQRSRNLGIRLSDSEFRLLVTAAWLHDVGYSPSVSETGMHAIDGARFLRGLGVSERLCGLVAYHSGAVFEAEERGLCDELSQFVDERSQVADVLVAADFTTGPQGQRMTVDERISEILERYDSDDPVYRAVTRSQDVLREQVARALARAGQPT